MTQTAYRYARALYELEMPAEALRETKACFAQCPLLLRVLEDPRVPWREKAASVERIFPACMGNFLKYLCKKGQIGSYPEILAAYEEYAASQSGVLRAQLLCVTPPDGERLEKMKDFLQKRHGAREVQIETEICPGLGGGFVLRAGGREYDWSVAGRLKRLTEKLARR